VAHHVGPVIVRTFRITVIHVHGKGTCVMVAVGALGLAASVSISNWFVRLRGRAMSLRVESNCTCTAWRLGSPRIDLRADGRKA